MFRKDESLNRLAEEGNVAQFVSFLPEHGRPVQAFCRVAGKGANHRFRTNGEAITELLSQSADGSINVRSFTPESPQSRDFFYGLSKADKTETLVNKLAAEGLHVIVNETVDIHDGGVSGVVQGDVIEFAPDDTPRCVEKSGAASLPLSMGLELLRRVYGFRASIPNVGLGRVEFSIHPKRRGWKQTQTLLWELQDVTAPPSVMAIRWPNRFSRHIGDKLYGLLVGDVLGLPVPFTNAICRRVKPFSFGRPTGLDEVWTRTCPVEQEPGRFTTAKGWRDPFRIMSVEDPEGDEIASVLCQAAVQAKWSGAALMDREGTTVIEGVLGEGDAFMLGERSPEMLPARIKEDVWNLFERARALLGAVRFEWVHDGRQAWIVQLHVGRTDTCSDMLVPGRPKHWHEFDVKLGLEALRSVLSELRSDAGIDLVGEVGLTSHFADVLRKVGRPARITR
jgi:hypothetical protein